MLTFAGPNIPVHPQGTLERRLSGVPLDSQIGNTGMAFLVIVPGEPLPVQVWPWRPGRAGWSEVTQKVGAGPGRTRTQDSCLLVCRSLHYTMQISKT